MALNKHFLKKIRKIVGPDNVNVDIEDLIPYGYDGSVAGNYPPDLVVRPGSACEVSDIVKVAADEGVPIVPRGAGTGLSGGSVAVNGGMLLHFSRMNRIRKLDRRNMYAFVGPGVVNSDLKKAALAAGLFYPPDPSSLAVCTIGGNVAENSGGPYSTKYGVTGDYVLGLEAVLSGGEVIRTGGVVRRNVAGYDLTSLLVGSEGTIAVITEATLRLLPKPPARSAALFAFEDIFFAGEAVVRIGEEGVLPAALELVDEVAIKCVSDYRPGLFPDNAAAVLLLEIDGEAAGVEAQMSRAGQIFRSAGARMIKRVEGEEGAESLWDARRAVSAALGRMGTKKVGEDISVPPSKLPHIIECIREISVNHGLPIAIFGHAAAGVLHPNILADRRDERMAGKIDGAISDLFAAALSMKGTISGEHGIGMAKAPWIKDALTPETIGAMKKIKKALDPAGIMNPGKIFP